MSAIIDKVTPIIQPIVESVQCELVDIEYVKEGKNWFLRVFADKPGRIDIDECALISEKISEALDAIHPDPFPEAYFLEVSSPGAERPLKTPEAVQQAIGRYVHLDYYAPQYGEKQHEGVLLNVTETHYELQIRVKTVSKVISIERSAVAKIRLAIQF